MQYGAGLVRLFKAVACLGLYLTLDRYFPIRLLEVDRFFRASISYKCGGPEHTLQQCSSSPLEMC